MKQSILITGASGFIGSFLVEEALRQGFDTWAGIRKSSSKKFLGDKRIHFIELDFGDTEVLGRQLRTHHNENGPWDVVIHCAGATKCKKDEDFEKHNYWATRNLTVELRRQGMRPKQFVYISSLSIFGPIRDKATHPKTDKWIYDPILETDTPKPNTAYGRSKVKTENYLKSLQDYPYLIFRPTGVYGPRERDYFLMAKSIKKHTDFAVGFTKQEITFVYVKDLVQAIFLGIEKGVVQREYFVSDGDVYDSRTFSDLLQKELDVHFVLHFRSPLWLLKVICGVSGWFARMMGKVSTLNPDKYQIMKQRNWQCDIEPLKRELGYEPKYNLERGVAEAIKWYKENKWL